MNKMENFEVDFLEAQLEIGKAVIKSMLELIPKERHRKDNHTCDY